MNNDSRADHRSEYEATSQQVFEHALALARRLPDDQRRRARDITRELVALRRMVPSLFAPTGRLDANAVATALAASAEQLAKSLRVPQRLLAREPDAPAIQERLVSMARVIAALLVLPPPRRAMWLLRPNRLADGGSPQELILAGQSARVALLLESAVGVLR